VVFGEHRMMLRPRDSHDLRLLEATLEISPSAQLHWRHDVFGNSVTVAEFLEPADRLHIESQIVIDRYPLFDRNFRMEPYAKRLPFSYPASEVPDLGRTIERHYPDPERLVNEWTRRHLEAPHLNGETEAFLRELTAAIRREFTYYERHAPGTQTPVETLQLMSGTCRDFALLMMEAVRSVGLASRFVSGYLYDPALDGAASEILGAGATHAWVQVYLPGAGWIEFDPTNGGAGGHNLVPIAVAREPQQAIPIAGTFSAGDSKFLGMEVEVSVRSNTVPEIAA
jgi:transglutaminase-like putative cysteine protease